MTSTASPTDRRNRSQYDLRPLVVDAAEAHNAGIIQYAEDGTVTCRHPMFARDEARAELRFPPSRQYPLVRATLDDLNKALSRLANSPRLENKRTLRETYEAEVALYEERAANSYTEGRFEPDYGSYVIDAARGDLYLVAPETWHRLALVTSNSMLLVDPEAQLSWREVRRRLEGAVIGFAGVSVGGNVLEGWLREARPKQAKLADPDWVELTNFNRGERMSIRHVVASRAARFDPRNPYETPRVSKAQYIAYEQQLVDPYLTLWVYDEGITSSNMDRFLLGDGGDGPEPRIDVLVEETDDPEIKLAIREACRRHGIDVLMLSDFGHRVHGMWNPFASRPQAPLGLAADDNWLTTTVAQAKAGDRSKIFAFVEGLCGPGYGDERTIAFASGKGEHPTSSLPQSGATAMASGAIGGKELALHVLGHDLSRRGRVMYDFLRREVLP